MNAVNWVNARGQTSAVGPKGRKARRVQWLGAPAFGVGALDVASNGFAKGLLASWNATDGANWINQYGLQPGDVDPNAWYDRDGYVLAGFVKWWNGTNAQKLPEPGTKNGVAWVDLTQQHLTTLQNWALSKGIINPGQLPASPQPTPVPMDMSTCLANCQNTYGLDPISLATCAAACAQSFPLTPPPVPISPTPTTPAPTTPPSTPPPTIPTAPVTPGTTTTSESKTNVWPWVIGGTALVALGALVLSGGK